MNVSNLPTCFFELMAWFLNTWRILDVFFSPCLWAAVSADNLEPLTWYCNIKLCSITVEGRTNFQLFQMMQEKNNEW